MKKHAVAMLLLFLWSSVTMAEDWSQTFRETYAAKGVDEAVVNALSSGITPDQILKTGLPIVGLQPAELIKALFCALVPPAYIYDAATVNSVKDETVLEGYELALAQCAEAMEEKENSAPVFLPGQQPAGIGGSGAPPPAPPAPGPTSPSNFGR